MIEPRTVGRHDVQMPAGTRSEPSLDLRMLMRGVVIDDQVDVEIRRYRGFMVREKRYRNPQDMLVINGTRH